MDFKELINTLSKINEELREHSIRAVNTSLTLRNWFFGFYIVEYEQSGNDRAEYGKALLAKLSQETSILNISNTEERELRRYRQFYTTYPPIGQLFLQNNQKWGLLPEFQIRQSLTANSSIRGLPNPELEIPPQHYLKLFNQISYTHFKELIRINDPLKRTFYEI